MAAEGSCHPLDGAVGSVNLTLDGGIQGGILGFREGCQRVSCFLVVACAVEGVADTEDIVGIVVDGVPAVPGFYGIHGLRVFASLPQVARLADLGRSYLAGDIDAAVHDLLNAGRGALVFSAEGLEGLGVGLAAFIADGPCLIQVRGILGQQVGNGCGVLRPGVDVRRCHVDVVLLDGHVSRTFGQTATTTIVLIVLIVFVASYKAKAHRQCSHHKNFLHCTEFIVNNYPSIFQFFNLSIFHFFRNHPTNATPSANSFSDLYFPPPMLRCV